MTSSSLGQQENSIKNEFKFAGPGGTWTAMFLLCDRAPAVSKALREGGADLNAVDETLKELIEISVQARVHFNLWKGQLEAAGLYPREQGA